jgi:hypothetical protein
MTTFDKREEAFERQFVHDEGVRFKALARRNKRLGLWAAERLGRTGAEAESYAKALAAIELQHHSDAEVASKIQRDLEAAGVSISEAEIRHLMGELLANAIARSRTGDRLAVSRASRRGRERGSAAYDRIGVLPLSCQNPA